VATCFCSELLGLGVRDVYDLVSLFREQDAPEKTLLIFAMLANSGQMPHKQVKPFLTLKKGKTMVS